MEFHETARGARFFDSTMPKLVLAITHLTEDLAKCIEEIQENTRAVKENTKRLDLLIARQEAKEQSKGKEFTFRENFPY